MRQTLGAYLMMVATALFWGSNFVVGKYLVHIVEPFTIAVFRFGIAAGCLGLYALFSEQRPQKFCCRSVFLLVAAGLMGTFLANGLVFPALQYSSAVNGSIIMALIPATTAGLAALFTGYALRKGTILSLLVSFSGVLIILMPGQEINSLQINRGDGLFLLAMFCGALNYLIVKYALTYFSPLVITAGSLLCGSFLMLPFALRELALGQSLRLPLKAWLLILYMALVTTSLGFYFWNVGIERLGPARAAAFFNLIPIFTVMLSSLFLQEEVSVKQIAGLVLIIGGIVGNQIFAKDRVEEKIN